MGIGEQLIDEIVQRVLSVASPQRIILYGSAATDNMTGDSDIDLLVLQQEAVDEKAQWLRIRQVLRGLGYPFDIVIMSLERFERTKNTVGGLAYPAQRHGKVIYDAA